MAMRYYFRVAPPEDIVKLRILETDSDGPILSATFSGKRKSLTSRSLLFAFASLPLVTLKIMAAIHWEALRLWIKGAKLVERPATKIGLADQKPAQGFGQKEFGQKGLGHRATSH